MYNLKDFPAIEKEFAAVVDEPGHEVLEAKYCGPNTGLIYDEATKKIKVHSEWAPDADGNIVNILKNTGPATGKTLHDDGVIR